MTIADKLYITKVHRSYEADVYFPVIEDIMWEMVSNEDHNQTEPQLLNFSYQVYTRR